MLLVSLKHNVEECFTLSPYKKKRRLIPVSPQKQQAMIVCPKPTFGGHPVLTLAATAIVFAAKVFFDKKQKQRAKAK